MVDRHIGLMYFLLKSHRDLGRHKKAYSKTNIQRHIGPGIAEIILTKTNKMGSHSTQYTATVAQTAQYWWGADTEIDGPEQRTKKQAHTTMPS